MRQAMAFETLPRHAAVRRFEQPAAGTAADAAPGVDLDLPHAGEQDPRVVWIHRHVGAAGVLVDEQGPLPRLTAVGRPVDTALLLRTIGVTERAGQRDVGVVRVDDDAADAAGLIEPLVHPGPARVGRSI